MSAVEQDHPLKRAKAVKSRIREKLDSILAEQSYTASDFRTKGLGSVAISLISYVEKHTGWAVAEQLGNLIVLVMSPQGRRDPTKAIQDAMRRHAFNPNAIQAIVDDLQRVGGPLAEELLDVLDEWASEFNFRLKR